MPEEVVGLDLRAGGADGPLQALTTTYELVPASTYSTAVRYLLVLASKSMSQRYVK